MIGHAEEEGDAAIEVVTPMGQYGSGGEPPSPLANKEQIDVPIQQQQREAQRCCSGE
jgi:hypothetical protein